MQQWVVISLTVGFLAGCEMVETGGTDMPNLPPGAQDTCGAVRFAYLIGQPRTAAEAAALSVDARIIGLDDAVTMDFSAQRLNVLLNADNLVERLTCG